ncbi:Phosphatidylserine decarboxylase proenzyme-like protein [Emericellopsis cladophorae]|uniref:Phosphatidylserine decarboxylase proenzyme 1, mitochondrial n=1 Tax=Emericellopsis cladophorae TaxID=2686198 RepID=A0A9Q0BF84_9HYPO|nr:Phosphatidylserine decarboxylase proenzyme-like protein [Emericellopsis cladophorae]KAI6783217.1 Phosphatidylserine decarboxylase proenzyme-like protein [Emericellopsis cladophorae]
MASFGIGLGQATRRTAVSRSCTHCARSTTRSSTATRRAFSSNNGPRRPRFSQRLGEALRNSKVTWYPIPVGLGVGFLGLVQFYKVQTREKQKQDEIENGERPQKRPRVKLEGPWQVQVMSTLPLKAISRLWGRFNELNIPYYLRVPGFKLYSFVFGVDLNEVAEPDLHTYPNLAAFFFRKLKPGSRPLHPDPHMVLSPADGRVLQFGQIEGGDIEQVKGMTYSIDALLGKRTPTPSINGEANGVTPEDAARASREASAQEEVIKRDEKFAEINGIPYKLPDLLSGSGQGQTVEDMSLGTKPSTVSEVGAELALGERPWYDMLSPDKTTSLYYAVVYLAPGDYHRFHSPTNWVVERRRHFAGELYSVSPYLQRTLPGLFTLNERVVLLGRWRWGFFSYIPVGATNVGSIVINFDRELRTNSLLTDTAADRAAEEAAKRGEPYLGFAEASYEGASRVLGGHALGRGDEMGGFQLGSTIVLVFEAPSEGAAGSRKGWEWMVQKGQKVKMGQALGKVLEE